MNVFATFKCNMNCPFCSLHEETKDKIDLQWMNDEFKKHPELTTNINILGGEPSTLSSSYQQEIIEICTKFGKRKPYYITNLLKISPLLHLCDPIVSYDFNLREYGDRVLSNILSLDMEYSLSTILTNNLVENIGHQKYIKLVTSLKGCKRADLDLYYHHPSVKIDYTPNKNKLLEFISEAIKCEKVNIAPLSSYRKNIDISTNNISEFFAFLPNKKYGVRFGSTSLGEMGYIPFDSFDKAFEFFEKRIKTDCECKRCKYVNHCWRPFTNLNGCDIDKNIMRLFENVRQCV